MTRAKKKSEPAQEQPKDEQAEETEEVEFDLGWPPDAEFVDPPPPEKT
jgi:hypothetical protein